MGCDCSCCESCEKCKKCCDCFKCPPTCRVCSKDCLSISLAFFQAASFAISFVIMFWTNKIYFDSDTSRSIAQELIDNFNNKYYTRFIFGNDKLYSSNLLSELNSIPNHFDKWPGTVEGCGKKDNTSKIREKESCEKDEVFLEAIPLKYIYKYADISFDIEKSQKTYLDLFNEGSIIKPDKNKKKNEQCPEGKKNCGYIDTKENILCLSNNTDCPINYISIYSKEKPEKEKNLKEIKGKDRVLYYSNDPYPDSEEYPNIIGAFKIADLERICAVPNLYYSSIPLFKLEVLNKNYSRECQLEDYSLKVVEDHFTRYSLIDEINFYDLYKENGIIQAIEESPLVNYGFDVTKYKKINVGLYYRRYIGFDKECLEKRPTKLDLNKLIIDYGKSDKMKKWSNELYGLIITSISCLTDLIDFTGNIFEIIVKLILSIGPSIYFFFYSCCALSFDDDYEDEMDCSDVVTNSNYNIMIEKIRKSGKNIKCTLWFLGLEIALNLISYIISFLLFKKKISSNPNT